MKKEKGIVLIQKHGQHYLNGKPVELDEVAKYVETVIILPAKVGDDLKNNGL